MSEEYYFPNMFGHDRTHIGIDLEGVTFEELQAYAGILSAMIKALEEAKNDEKGPWIQDDHEFFYLMEVEENYGAQKTIAVIKAISQQFPETLISIQVTAPIAYADTVEEGFVHNNNAAETRYENIVSSWAYVKNGVIMQEPTELDYRKMDEEEKK
jgi:hypothetical protein